MKEYNLLKQKIIEKSKLRGFQNFNIDNPKTWCEKIQWLQLNDDIDKRAFCADKIKVHNYSIERLGKDICVPILKIYNSPDEINFDELPNQFVLKCNHGWNMNIICDDKLKLDINEIKEKLKIWLNTPFGEKSIELHYLKIERKCFFEKYLGNPLDYKFWCFEGKPIYCTVNTNIGNNASSSYYINWYDINWNFINFSRIDHCNNPNIINEKPSQFELMKEYAKKLSNGWHFVRVDFYEVNGVVYLGEMTFTPASGFIKWTDENIDRMFGDMIKL